VVEEWKKPYVNLFTTSGEPLWENAVCASLEEINSSLANMVKISNFDESSYLAVWADNRIYNDNFLTYKLIAQRFDENGNKLWNEEGNLIAYPSDMAYDIFPLEVYKNFILYRHSTFEDNRIFIVKLDENGNISEGWGESGILLSDNRKIDDDITLYQTDNNLLIIWKEENNYREKIKAQLLSQSGEKLWDDNGKDLVSYDSFHQISDFVVNTQNNYFIICDNSHNETDSSLNVQKFDYSGNSIWNNPTQIYASSSSYYFGKSSITVTQNNNIYITFSKRSGIYSQTDVFAQKLDENGSMIWNEEGISLCQYYFDEEPFGMIADNDNHVYTFWLDGRGSNSTDDGLAYNFSLYGQIFTDDAEVDNNIIPVGTIIANYPNPFKGSTKFVVNTKKKIEDGIIKIYNLKGELVKKILTENSITKWDGKNSKGKKIGSGIYFYKFISKNESSKVKKMILIK